MLEYETPEERAVRLGELVGLDRHLFLHIGSTEPVAAIFDNAQVSPTRVSSVQYVKFHLSEVQAALVKASGTVLRLVADHPAYRAQAVLSEETAAGARLRPRLSAGCCVRSYWMPISTRAIAWFTSFSAWARWLLVGEMYHPGRRGAGTSRCLASRPSCSEGTMERVKFVRHNGVTLLKVDLSHPTSIDESLAAIKQAKAIIGTHPPKSLLILTDVTGTTFNAKAVEEMKHYSAFKRRTSGQAPWWGSRDSRASSTTPLSR